MSKGVIIRTFNRIFGLIAQFSPGCTSLRPFLHRLRGVKIKGSIFIGDQVYLENEYPECIEIDDQAQIGLRSIIMAHFRGKGKVIIEKKVWIGPNCVIATSPGRTLTIGEGSVIAASSVIVSDVPPGSFVAGAKSRVIAEVTVPMTISTSYEDFKKGLKFPEKNA